MKKIRVMNIEQGNLINFLTKIGGGNTQTAR
jgi:hypothetical protein